MPRTSRATQRRPEMEPQIDTTATTVLDPEAVQQFVDGVDLFDPFDESIPLFRTQAMMADSDWERCMCYLYRLEPPVRNADKEPSYIEKGTRIDEEFVKNEHGGGKYKLWLRDDTNPKAKRERYTIFRIDGPPKFKPGQTAAPVKSELLPPPSSPSPAPPRETDTSAIASVVREMLQNQRQPDANSQTTIETMTRATAAAIEIVKTASVREAGSTTGNPLLDKLIEKLFDNSLHQQEPKSDSRINRLYDLAVERLLAGPQQQEQKDPLAQLGFVKDLLGVENIGDLFNSVKGGSDWRTEAFKLVGGLATNLPALLSFFAQQGELNFRRQLAIIEARRNGLGSPAVQQLQPAAAFSPNQPATVSPGVASTPIGVSSMSPQIDLTQLALTDIVVSFNNGIEGNVAASMVRDKYPELVEQLKPLLANEQKVLLFAQNTPPLNQIAGDTEFPEFFKEFCSEVLNPEPDEASPEAS